MIQYPQWAVGLDLWISTFDKKDLKLSAYSEIKSAWAQSSGWNTDRIAGSRLKSDKHKFELIFDMYVFDIHKDDCRVTAKIYNNTIYVQGVYSHAEYDKWWKKAVHIGKQKR